MRKFVYLDFVVPFILRFFLIIQKFLRENSDVIFFEQENLYVWMPFHPIRLEYDI